MVELLNGKVCQFHGTIFEILRQYNCKTLLLLIASSKRVLKLNKIFFGALPKQVQPPNRTTFVEGRLNFFNVFIRYVPKWDDLMEVSVQPWARTFEQKYINIYHALADLS